MSSSQSTRPKAPSTINNGKFELKKKIGAGCFGEVHIGRNTENDEEVAIKLEDCQTQAPQLEHEATILNILRHPVQSQHFVEYFYFGREGQYQCMVMELLGKSLEDRMNSCRGQFTVKTTVLVAEQVLNGIEYLHSKGIVHRDIKPENFMFGVKRKVHHIYIIDFGLSKKYFETKHVMMKQKLSLTGTARYASVNAHRGLEQSRRDDLEAIGHMFMYFLRGALPWSGLEARTKQEKYRKIREKKEEVPLNELCKGYPEAFETYLQYTRNLQFMQIPDYNMLRKLFRALREEQGNPEDHAFQWFDGKDVGQLEPLQPPTNILQPDASQEVSRRTLCFCGNRSAVVD